MAGKSEQRLNITHGAIIARYWGSIFGTLALMLSSSFLAVLQPFALGLAINGLTEERWDGVFLLVLLQASLLVFMLARRFYDTRVYARIYREIGEEVVTESQRAGVELTRLSARTKMLREVVNFFEYRLPWTLRAFVNLVGALGLLAFLSFSVFLASMGAMAAVVLVSFVFTTLLLRVNKDINDQEEEEVGILETKEPERTGDHLARLAKFQIRRSDLDVVMFALINAPLVGVLIFALYQVVLVEAAAMGTVFSVFSYVTRFQFSMYVLPDAYQELLRTMEITRRINQTGKRRGEAPGETSSALADKAAGFPERRVDLALLEPLRRAAPSFARLSGWSAD